MKIKMAQKNREDTIGTTVKQTRQSSLTPKIKKVKIEVGMGSRAFTVRTRETGMFFRPNNNNIILFVFFFFFLKRMINYYYYRFFFVYFFFFLSSLFFFSSSLLSFYCSFLSYFFLYPTNLEMPKGRRSTMATLQGGRT